MFKAKKNRFLASIAALWAVYWVAEKQYGIAIFSERFAFSGGSLGTDMTNLGFVIGLAPSVIVFVYLWVQSANG